MQCVHETMTNVERVCEILSESEILSETWYVHVPVIAVVMQVQPRLL